jgi:predicted RNA-binding Zn ribbon-like protein
LKCERSVSCQRSGLAPGSHTLLEVAERHPRQWCSMAACGNRAKARRHYARARDT